MRKEIEGGREGGRNDIPELELAQKTVVFGHGTFAFVDL